MNISAMIEAKRDAPDFIKLSDDDRARYTISKMKEFTNRFGIENSTSYCKEYFKALAEEIKNE